MNEEVFDELYDDASIDNLTTIEMEKYKQSVEDYGDMISVAIYNREEGEKRGIVIGEKRGIEKERARTVNRLRSQGRSIKEIAEFLGLTEEQVYNLLDS
jgi:predicted transposase/invertase (TIGR01784 family)